MEDTGRGVNGKIWVNGETVFADRSRMGGCPNCIWSINRCNSHEALVGMYSSQRMLLVPTRCFLRRLICNRLLRYMCGPHSTSTQYRCPSCCKGVYEQRIFCSIFDPHQFKFCGDLVYLSLVYSLCLTLGIQDQTNNQAIQTQDFAKNQYQHHADEDSWLLHVTSDAHIAHNADCVSSSQTWQPNAETSCEMHETSEQAVRIFRRWRHVSCNENCNNQSVNCDNTRHDNRNKRL